MKFFASAPDGPSLGTWNARAADGSVGNVLPTMAGLAARLSTRFGPIFIFCYESVAKWSLGWTGMVR